MTERISGEARAAVVRAQEQARRLGQDFIGCEHLLYGVAGADDAAGSVLRARGVTPERVEDQVAALLSRGRGRGLGRGRTAAVRAGELDRGALAAIGIDIDAVRARVEEAFGPGSLDRAAAPRRNRVREGHLRVTRQARRCIDRSMREAAAHQAASQQTASEQTASQQAESTGARPADAHGAGHIALSLLNMDTSVTRSILTALGVSAAQLTAEIKTAL